MTAKIINLKMEQMASFVPANGCPSNIDEIVEYNLQHPEFRTMAAIMVGDVFVAICGYASVGPSNLEVFLIPSKYITKYAKEVVRALRLMTDVLIEGHVVRLQMPVLQEYRKWAEALGFSFEGVVRKYLDNKDHFMYVKVRT